MSEITQAFRAITELELGWQKVNTGGSDYLAYMLDGYCDYLRIAHEDYITYIDRARECLQLAKEARETMNVTLDGYIDMYYSDNK